jgi:hypothetical protein
MSTYDAIRDAARDFEREFVRSDPAMPAPATLATLVQDLTGLIGSLPGATSGIASTSAAAQVVPLGHSAEQAALNRAYFAAANAAHAVAVEAAAADAAAQQAVAATQTTTA